MRYSLACGGLRGLYDICLVRKTNSGRMVDMPEPTPPLQNEVLPSARFRWNWRTVFLLLLLSALLIAIAMLSGSFVISASQASRTQGQALMRAANNQVAERTRQLLAGAEQAMDIAAGLSAAGALGGRDIESVQRYFMETVRRDRSLDGMYFADREGNFSYAARDHSGRGDFLTKTITVNGKGKQVTISFRDFRLNPIAIGRGEFDGYDPRRRPWYRVAMNQRGGGWTGPYVFWTAHAPGITASRAATCLDGSDGCAIGADFTLIGLSDFLSTLRIGKSGVPFVLTRKGEVVAYPNAKLLSAALRPAPRTDDPTALPGIAQFADTKIAEAVAALDRPLGAFSDTSPHFAAFESGGQRYLATFSLFIEGEITWIVGVYVPERDFFGWFFDLQRQNLALAGLVLALTMILATLLWRALSRAFHRLDANAHAIAAMRFDQVLPPSSGFADIHHLESAFSKMARAIQDEQASTAAALNSALVASKAKSDFLAHMSHEFRTPLNAIIGFGEFVHQIAGQKLSEKECEYLRDIVSAGRHLTDLIGDALDLSQIEAGRMELTLRDFSLADSLDAAIRMIEARMRAKALSFRADIDRSIHCHADQRRVTQAVINILTNATKFTPDGGSIELIARRCPDSPVDAAGDAAGDDRGDGSGDGIEISISDTGIGMEPHEIKLALEPFTRVSGDPLVAHEGGVGLGLPIARALIEAHGGTLTIESQRGHGTTVRLVLPKSRLL